MTYSAPVKSGSIQLPGLYGSPLSIPSSGLDPLYDSSNLNVASTTSYFSPSCASLANLVATTLARKTLFASLNCSSSVFSGKEHATESGLMTQRINS